MAATQQSKGDLQMLPALSLSYVRIVHQGWDVRRQEGQTRHDYKGCGLWVNQAGMEPKHVAKRCELWNRPTAVRM